VGVIQNNPHNFNEEKNDTRQISENKMEKMKIEDNWLEQENFDVLQTIMMGGDLAWFFNNCIVDENDTSRFQFTHTFYQNFQPHSEQFRILYHVVEKLQAVSMWRIKANLRPKTSKEEFYADTYDTIERSSFHCDIGDLETSPEKLKLWTTSILYINTNNGYTEFEDGTQVESVANRIVTFPADTKHNGVACTDKKTRIVINFNYFKK